MQKLLWIEFLQFCVYKGNGTVFKIPQWLKNTFKIDGTVEVINIRLEYIFYPSSKIYSFMI